MAWRAQVALLLLAAASATAQELVLQQPVEVSSSHALAADAALPAAPSAVRAQVESDRVLAVQSFTPEERWRALEPGEKFQLFLQQTSSPYTFTTAGVTAGLSYANGGRGFEPGWSSFDERYKLALVDSGSGAFFKKFLLPVLLKQDPRYRRSGKAAFGSRLLHALTSIVETDNDLGEPTFNYSQVVGSALSASVANVYYPKGSRGLHHTVKRTANTLGADAGVNVFKEFWPDLKKKLFQRDQRPELEFINKDAMSEQR